jgi:hypothetical protein
MPQFTTFRRARAYFNRICHDSDSNGMWFVERINGLRLFISQDEPITSEDDLQHKLQNLFRSFGFQENLNEIPEGYHVTFERSRW